MKCFFIYLFIKVGYELEMALEKYLQGLKVSPTSTQFLIENFAVLLSFARKMF